MGFPPSTVPDVGVPQAAPLAPTSVSPYTNALWFAGTMDKGICSSFVSLAEPGDFLVREEGPGHHVICFNDGRGARELDVVGEGMSAEEIAADSRPVLTGPLSDADVGARVTVVGYDCPGTLRFFGKHAIKSGVRCGIDLDLPIGNNDGSIAGHVYFVAGDKRGVLVSVDKVARSARAPSTPSAGMVLDEAAFKSLFEIVTLLRSDRSPAGRPLRRAALCMNVLDPMPPSKAADGDVDYASSIPGGKSFRPNVIRGNLPQSIAKTARKCPFLLVFKRESKTLKEVIRDEAIHLDPAACISAVVDICKSIQVLHESSILYGLLTPDTVLRTVRRGRATFRLYGLANATAFGPPCKLQNSGMQEGIRYVVPEIAKLVDADASTVIVIEEDDDDLASAAQVDLWAVACLMYECFVGEPMVASGSKTATGTPAEWTGFTSDQRHRLFNSAGGHPLLDLLDWMTDADNDSRPGSIEEVFSHRFLAADGTLRRDRFLSAVNVHLTANGDMIGTGADTDGDDAATAKDNINPKVAFFSSPGDEAIVLPIALDLAPFMRKMWLGLRDANDPSTTLVAEDVLDACDTIIVFISSSYCEVPSNWQLFDKISRSGTRVVAVNVDVPAHEWPPKAFRQCDALETMSAGDLIETFGAHEEGVERRRIGGLRFAAAMEGSNVDDFWIHKMGVLRGALMAKQTVLQESRDAAEKQASAVQASFAALEEEKDEMRATIQMLRSQGDALKISLAAAAREAKSLAATSSEFEADRQKRKADREKWQKERKGLKKELATTAKESKAYEEQVSQLGAAFEQIQATCVAQQDDHSAAINAMAEQIKALERDIAASKQALKIERSLARAAAEEAAEMAEKSTGTTAEGAEAPSAATGADLDAVRAELSALQRSFEAQTAELQDAHAKFKKMRAKAKCFQEKLKAVPAAGANAGSRTEEASDQLEFDEVHSELVGVKQQLAEAHAAHDAAVAASEKTIRGLRDELECKSNGGAFELRAKLEQVQSKAASEVSKVKADLAKTKRELKTAKSSSGNDTTGAAAANPSTEIAELKAAAAETAKRHQSELSRVKKVLRKKAQDAAASLRQDAEKLREQLESGGVGGSSAAVDAAELAELQGEVSHLRKLLTEASRRRPASGGNPEVIQLEREVDEARSEVAEWKLRSSELEDKCIALARASRVMRERLQGAGLAGSPSAGGGGGSGGSSGASTPSSNTPKRKSNFLRALLDPNN